MSAGVVHNNNPGNAVVMTQVVPTPGTMQSTVQTGPGVPNVVIPVSNIGPSAKSSLKKFLKVHPKCLGGFEIFTGVITLGLGITMTLTWPLLSGYSGIVYWGSIIYIIAGSLTVAGGTNLNSCLIKGSLGMNVVSAVVAITSIIIICMDMVIIGMAYQMGATSGKNFTGPVELEVCNYFTQSAPITKPQSSSILDPTNYDWIRLPLSILVFIISICLSVFGCKATCCIEPEAVYYTNSSTAVNYLPTEQPPAYSASQYETK